MARVQFTEDTKPEPEVPTALRVTSKTRRLTYSEIQAKKFGVQHYWTLSLFLWFLLLHISGIYLFTKGFLLTRLVLKSKSECASPPASLSEHGSKEGGCWYPAKFEKAVIVIIDALRYDFTVPHKDAHAFHNALTVMHEMAVAAPQNAFLLPFIADPPTATLQRIKGLTTGTLPTFIDIGSNFAGSAIDDDNLLSQMAAQNRSIVHLGDDTWHALYPGLFEPNLTRPYESFNVWDLYTLDTGVTEHIIPYLQMADRWDLLIGHYLGVDHAGHRYGPDHPQMTSKLKEMDMVIRDMIEALPEDTVLIVMGDHGMDAKGDHGGDTDDEVEAALWMYSRRPAFGRTSPESLLPPSNAKTRAVAQIDLVPTLALLLGLPIPFSNLGSPIEEAFIGPGGDRWDELAKANMLTSAQIRKYQTEYAAARGASTEIQSEPNKLWRAAGEFWEAASSHKEDQIRYREAAYAWSRYMKSNLQVCKDLWANFDIPCMVMGASVLAATLGVFIRFARSRQLDPANSQIVALGMLVGSVLGAFVGGIGSLASIPVATSDLTIVGACVGSLLAGLRMWQARGDLSMPLPSTVWGFLSLFFTISQAIGFASNSFTIWEDEMLLFYLTTFGILALCSSFRQRDDRERALGIYHSVLFMLLTRMASFSRLCREEQSPYCNTTYYASANSSTPANWHLIIPFLVAAVLPLVIRTYYENTGSLVGTIVPWINFAFWPGLGLSAAHWTLNAADDNDWFDFVSRDTLASSKRAVALMVLFTAFVVGGLAFVWTIPPLRVDNIDMAGINKKTAAQPVVSIAGLNNLHGSRYSFLVTAFLLGVVMLQKPMGGGAMAVMAWQVFSLLEIVHTNGLRRSSIAPVVLAMMGNFYFFKTGHQAVLQSIQWDTAFIPLKSVRYPWSALVIILNAFGPQMLACIAVPLLVLWRQPAKAKGLLKLVVQAIASHLAYHATLNFFTVVWTGHLRRHLMLFKIFSPRFMTSSIVLLVVDLVAVFVSLLGFRTNTVSVAEIFGWP